MTVLFILLVLLLVLKIAASTYMRIMELESDLDEYLIKIGAQLALQTELIQDLGDMLKGHPDSGYEAFGIISNLRLENLTSDSLPECAGTFYQRRDLINRFIKGEEGNPKIRNLDNFKNFRTKLSVVNNRISLERQLYNDIAFRYNCVIDTAVGSLIAKLLKRTEQPYFELTAS